MSLRQLAIDIAFDSGAAIGDLLKIDSIIDDIAESAPSIADKLGGIGDSLSDVGKDMSLKVTTPLMAMGGLAVKSASDFESAFAGVRKTVDATEAEFIVFEQGIRNMAKEMPQSAVEIATVAEAAGQLGIENDAILSFTKTMVNMGVATDMSSDSAAMALARLATITQMNQQDFDKLGSTIVGLGNNLAATESEIVEMGLRLAGAGSVIGMSEAEILGFSGALAAVGINAEAGGSAFSKLFIEAANLSATGGKGLTEFAKVAGMSGKEFQKAFEEDATSAIISFIEGLGKINETGGNVFGVLDDLGLSEIRLRDALLRTSGAGDVLREAVQLGTEAWEENTALTDEAEERYKTFASQLSMFKNHLVDLGITLGSIILPVLSSAMDYIAPWIERFSELDTSIQTTILIIGGIAAAIGPVLLVMGTMISSIGSIIGVAGKMATAIKGAGGVMAVLTNPIGLTVAAIGLFVGALIYAYNESEWFREKVDAAWEWIKGSTSTAFEWIKGIVVAVMGSVGEFIGGILSKITDFWGENTTSAMTIVEFAFNYIKNNIMMTMGVIQGIFQIVWPIISETVQVAWALIQTIVNTSIDIVLGLISAGMSLLQGDWQGAWEAIKGIGESIWNNIEAFFSGINLHEIGANIIQGLIDGIGSMADAVTKRIESIANGISNAFKNIFQIKSPSRLFESYGIDTMLGYTIGFEDEASNAINASEEAAFNIADSFEPDIPYQYQSNNDSPPQQQSNTDNSMVQGIHFNPIIEVLVQGNADGEEIKRILERYFPDLMEEFFAMLAAKRGGAPA